jgi:hypothetical protein
MKSIKRRDFIKQTGYLSLGLVVSDLYANKNEKEINGDEIKISIPMPIQIVIDDVGWWSGKDGSAQQEPYRTGINRNHVPDDYQAIVDLGKKLGVRPQAATILCEWDRQNILRNLPTSTWMREKWDNSKWVGPWLDEAADIIRNNEKHYELTLHGIGHEYWDDEKFTRAEWADTSGIMRPLDQVELHLDYFAKLMEQNQLGSFPTSFVPTAFKHGFGPTGEQKTNIAEVIKRRGINYINTPFDDMYNAEAAQFELFGIDAGIMTVDRGNDLFDWNIIGRKPKGLLQGSTCGLHWPNLLHEDPERNTEIVDAWVKLLKPYNDKIETLLATDSQAFRNQLIHHECTKVKINETYIDIDFREADKLQEVQCSNQIIIKIASKQYLKFNSDKIKISDTNMLVNNSIRLYTLVLVRYPGYDKARIKFESS